MAILNPTKFIAKNGTQVTLRSPKVGDGAPLLQTVRRNFATSDFLLTQLEEFTYTEEQENEMIAGCERHPSKILIIPEVEGQIIGLMDFNSGTKIRNAHTGAFGMSILPEFRGIGVGAKMLAALLDWAETNPRIEKVSLKVQAKNEIAISLYKKFGFEIEGQEIKAIKFRDDHYDDVLLMAKFV